MKTKLHSMLLATEVLLFGFVYSGVVNAEVMDESHQSSVQSSEADSAKKMKMNDKKGMHHQGMPMPMMGMGMIRGGSAQGGSAPDDARDPHAYSDGFQRDPLKRLKLADEYTFTKVMLNRLEITSNQGTIAEVFDLQAWWGYDYNKLVFKTEGDINEVALEEASSELMWGHAIASFWDTQLGVRYDNYRDLPNATWLALGVQGLAPYWFELDATFYVGEDSRTSFSIEAEYELLITQKLILQPRFESTLNGKSDVEKGIGSGLSDASFGIRLRYEFKREVAPYIGMEWRGKFGKTADMAEASGETVNDGLMMVGLRAWF